MIYCLTLEPGRLRFREHGNVSTSPDVVVIGAGIIGCSVAYHLAARGATNVVVLEKDEIGRGATADAAGGIRLQFSTRTNIELSLVSLQVWEHFRQEFGVDIGLRQQGYLFLLTHEPELDVFRANLRLQQQLGVPSRWVDPDDIARLNPAVRLDDVLGGTFCARDGWADPYSGTMGFAAAARRLGVEIREGVAVIGFLQREGRIRGVETTQGPIGSDLTIICAGPHTGEVARLAGIDVPIEPYRRMSFVTDTFGAIPSSVPMTIDFATSLYFHPEGDGFLFGMANPNEPPGYNRTVDDDWMATTVEALCDRAPVFERATIKRGWAGCYEITPDDNPVLGYIDETHSLAIAAGFSGHGFMQGPAIGACIAELVVDGVAATADITPFSPTRFREGKLLQEHNVI
jgi:sarcosine oxidase subunit beta